MKLLDLYNEYVERKSLIGVFGLCWDIHTYISETECDEFQLLMAPYDNKTGDAYFHDDGNEYWGSGHPTARHLGVATDLRLNLLLLYAAYKGELK